LEPWQPLLTLGWLASVIAASIVYRIKVGKPMFPRLPANALFSERACSGRSLRTPWARIGGAQNCLLVAVTADALTVSPFFPFNLMFLPEFYGLEVRIPGPSIGDVDDHQGLFRRKITISYATPDIRRIELRVRDPDALIDALRRIQRHG